MIQLQRLTGMRPGEVVIMRTCDVDVSGKSWTYRPESHKCEHHGIAREIELGPKAQRLLRQWFRPNVTEYVFRPDEAEGKRKAELRRRRKSKVQPSQQSRRKKSPKCKPTDRYSTDSYRRAISRACEKYDISQWFPNQLRHLFATEVRRRFGIEMARACLGHRSVLVTQVYAEVNRQAASEVVAKIG